jgi:hypothetical protein
VNKSLGTYRARHLAGVIVECRPTAGTVDEIMLLRESANKSRGDYNLGDSSWNVTSFCFQSRGR